MVAMATAAVAKAAAREVTRVAAATEVAGRAAVGVPSFLKNPPKFGYFWSYFLGITYVTRFSGLCPHSSLKAVDTRYSVYITIVKGYSLYYLFVLYKLHIF